MDSPSEILGVARDADEAELEQAYRRRVKEAHPDHGGSVREFQRVRAAYEELTTGDADAVEGVTTDATPEDSETDSAPGPEMSMVEYLDYEVLDDYGWSLDDDDLFAKAADAGLDAPDYGRFEMKRATNGSLLQAAERCDYSWPFACRGGACANCAVAVVEGDLSMPVDHILPTELTDRGFRLSCVGAPTTPEVKVVFNVKHLPDLDDLRLPPRPFKNGRGAD